MLDIILVVMISQIIDVSSMIGSIIGSAIGLLLLTLYYCKSVRVRTYMGNTDYMDKAIIKFRS